MFQYESLACKTTDLNDLLNAKVKQGWIVEGCQLMNNQAGVFLLLRKDVLIFDDEIIPLVNDTINIQIEKPIKKRPGRKPGSKNKVKNAKSA